MTIIATLDGGTQQ